jgi:hypothetical protein
VTGLVRWARLSFRLQRWEVLASVVGVAVLAALMLWFAWQLRMLAAAQPGCQDPHAYVPGCEAFAQRFQGLSDWAQGLLYLSWGAPSGWASSSACRSSRERSRAGPRASPGR